MKLGMILTAVVAALVSHQARAADLDTIVLPKSSDWVLDYAAERCSLIRTFGEGENSARLQIDSFGSLHGLRLMVAGTVLPRLPGGPDEIKVQLTPDPEARELMALQGTAGDVGAVSFGMMFLPDVDDTRGERMSQAERYARLKPQIIYQDQFAAATNSLLIILDGGRRKIELRTGTMSAPLNALRDCVRDLQKSWGLDPVQEETLLRPPLVRDDVMKRFVSKFPSRMIRDSQNAFVPVRINVDAAGKPGECVVQLEGIPEAFRKAVCEGLSHDFDPALDANGTPVPSIFSTLVNFMLH